MLWSGAVNNPAELFPAVKLIHFQLIAINFTGVNNLSFSTALHSFISRSLALTGSAEQHPQELRLCVSRKLHHRWEISGYTLRTAMTSSPLTQPPVGLLRIIQPTLHMSLHSLRALAGSSGRSKCSRTDGSLDCI